MGTQRPVEIHGGTEYYPPIFKKYLPSAVNDSDLMENFQAVSDSCHFSLRSLIMRIYPSLRYPPISPPVVLSPLLRLKGLISLSVHDVRGFHFDDTTIRDIVFAWPPLRCLATNNRHMVHSSRPFRPFAQVFST
jgi:hypothetical protein